MKSKLTFIILVIILSFNCVSQNKKTCDSTEDTFEELNTISIKKCDIQEKKDHPNTRKVTSNISTKNNRIAHYVRKGSQIGSKKKYIKPISKEILFSIVDEIPLFSKCNTNKSKECFNKEFYKHFAKNFNPESASEDGVKGRVFIQFTIDTRGNITNTLIKGPKNAINLENEIKRVINKLPTFKPAIHKGIPVNIKHGLPLNLTIDIFLLLKPQKNKLIKQ